MRLLLSTIGSRGDVQPLLALALQLQDLGHEARICAPPDFGDWIAGVGVGFFPIGPQVLSTANAAVPVVRTRPTPERMREIAAATVATQFEVIPAAAAGCAVLVAGGALQIALRTIAEQVGAAYVYVGYCPVTLPSPHHPPPAWQGDAATGAPHDDARLWAEDAERWNASWGVALNAQRTAAGLPAVADVRGHIFTATPWLAADSVLAPWPDPTGDAVVQTGAWILPDDRALSPELEAFLADGEPPVYFGFGSIRAPQDLARTMIQAARTLGRRAIVSRGWADLALVDEEPDCIAIGEVNQQALFPRVAAVVHHGGAGTTTAAARAGAPQLIIPQHYDQPYWAGRIERLRIGTAHAPGAPTVESLSRALRAALEPEVAVRARAVATRVRSDGAKTAAQRLLAISRPLGFVAGHSATDP